MVDAFTILQPFINLLEEPELKERVEETARIYFTGQGTTINLIPALIVGLLLLLGLLKLLGLPILSSFGLDGLGGGSDGGYGTSGNVEMRDFSQRVVNCVSGGSGYGQAYARGDYFDQSVADLQQQINQLTESTEALTNQVYYNVGGSAPSAISSNLLSSS